MRNLGFSRFFKKVLEQVLVTNMVEEKDVKRTTTLLNSLILCTLKLMVVPAVEEVGGYYCH